MPKAVKVVITIEMEQYATAVASRRAKRESTSPYVKGDETRVDRDVSGVICELAFYQWRYGNWKVLKARLDREEIARGLTDGGEDDVGIDVKGGHLVAGRELRWQHLLVKDEKVVPWVRYVAAFYAPAEHAVYLAGYLSGQALIAKCPEPKKVAQYGFLNRMVRVTELNSIRRIPHVDLADAA